ncbi:MAG: hypothetical protein J6X28_00735 [Bacilli bacterium]|nr:hypothetical protein [Bacilli bacterium]
MKNVKGIVFAVLCGTFFIGGIIGIKASLGGYSILFFTAAAIFLFFAVRYYSAGRTPIEVFEGEVRDTLNTYDSILIKCGSVPNFEDRNIVMVESMDDLVDAQLEIRKPICYLKQSESCSYALLDDKEAYVFIQKLNESVTSPVEIEIQHMKFKKRDGRDMDSEMLQDIDKTTIIKLSNKKSYKVSPIRKQEEEKKEVKPKEYETEYLFDEDEIQEKKVPADDVELLDC